jgi:hypothetical protein
MMLFFRNVLLFAAAWIIGALLNALLLCCFLSWQGDKEYTAAEIIFSSVGLGLLPQVLLGITTVAAEAVGTKGIPLFRFILRAAIVIWSAWLLILIYLFEFFNTSKGGVFFSSQLLCVVISISMFRSSIIRHE